MTQNVNRRIKRANRVSITALLCGAMALGMGGLIAGCPFPLNPDPETGCVESGGTVGTALCCAAVSYFPDTCAIGACGCAPEDSHEVMVCNCAESDCFNGTRCVPAP